MKTTATVIGVVAFMIVVSLVGRGLGFWAAQTVSGSPQGLIAERETFNKGCVQEAEKNMTNAQAVSYCNCAFTEGVAKYGEEGFTKELDKLGDTEKITPEMNVIVNKCIRGVL